MGIDNVVDYPIPLLAYCLVFVFIGGEVMRYIRTKDGEIIDTERYGNLVHNSLGYVTYLGAVIIKEKDIDREADTIEELCDEFVYKRTLSTGKVIYETFERIDREHHADDEFCRLVSPREDDYPDRQGIALEQVKNGVYGAIWTEKGLIYRAKMNEKGELELL